MANKNFTVRPYLSGPPWRKMPGLWASSLSSADYLPSGHRALQAISTTAPRPSEPSTPALIRRPAFAFAGLGDE
jgi:hypothetical protein